MIDFTVKGAIFDVDDTLLDNEPGLAEDSLHARSRLAAIREAGIRHKIPSLAHLSKEDNLHGFLTAPIHSLPGAVWNILYAKGVVPTRQMDGANTIFLEVVRRKNELYAGILREYGVLFPGAAEFVRSMYERTNGSIAVASSALRCDIDTFFEMTHLSELFSDNHIVSIESVTQIKPHPESFDTAFKRLQLPETDRRSVCAFEDDPRGIKSAKSAGLYVCAITSRFSKEHLLSQDVIPDMVADSYNEFQVLFGL